MNTAADQAADVKEYQERLQIALKSAKICVFEVDLVHQRYTFFENAEDIFGVSGGKILEDVRPYSELKPDEYQKAVSEYFSHPDDAEVIGRAFHSIFSGKSTSYEARMKAGDSAFVWCKIDVTPVMENGIPVKMIGVITDISEIKTKTDRLSEAVRHDGFTQLYNKNCSITLIRNILAKSDGRTHALILMDIDDFKRTNDLHGHAVGDRMVKAVADTLMRSFRKTDILGRFGGDEFILLIQDIPSREWLSQKLEKLLFCEVGGCLCTNSIGAALYPQDAKDYDALFLKADEALYHSKMKKKSYTFSSDCRRTQD